MKKEIAAAAVLICILAAALVNTYLVSRLSGQVCALISEAESACEAADWARAEDSARRAAALWRRSSTYTNIVLRHQDIGAAADTLSDLLKEIYTHNAGAAKAAADKALEHYTAIADSEKLLFGNIF